eukprot:3859697-Pyramimonas_sp.AAC.1
MFTDTSSQVCAHSLLCSRVRPSTCTGRAKVAGVGANYRTVLWCPCSTQFRGVELRVYDPQT